MNLTECNKQLINIVELLGEKLPKLIDLENQYQHRYNQLMLSSQRGNQAQREAEAMEILHTEEIYVTYHTLKVEVRVLLMRKDVFMEISRNLRSYASNI